MGVAPTGAIFKGLTFDGESSKDYGIYITGAAVYNAPARDVEMFSIPGRNGSFALDRGRFENIEVTYPAGLFGDSEADFAQGISDFRNFLASRQGYVELSDDYNPGEYRMAVYKSGLDVTPEQLRAGEFDIVFECKPQRWLTSGETEVTVTSGDTITNPTLFDARPILHATGYGNINIGGQTISIANNPLGHVTLMPAREFYDISRDQSQSGAATVSQTACTFDPGLLDDGVDEITLEMVTTATTSLTLTANNANVTAVTATITNDDFANVVGASTVSATVNSSKEVFISLRIQSGNFTYYAVPIVYTVEYDVVITNNGTTMSPLKFSTEVQFDAGQIKLVTKTDKPLPSILFTRSGIGPVSGNSSVSVTGGELYIDLDIGESYTILNGDIVNTNNLVSIGANLPTLSPGGNTITYSNTISDLKVIPRWWKV